MAPSPYLTKMLHPRVEASLAADENGVKAKAIAHYARVRHTCNCCIQGCKEQEQKYFNDEVALPFLEDGKVLYYLRNPFLIPNPKRNQLQNILIRQIYRRYCSILRIRNGITVQGVNIAL